MLCYVMLCLVMLPMEELLLETLVLVQTYRNVLKFEFWPILSDSIKTCAGVGVYGGRRPPSRRQA